MAEHLHAWQTWRSFSGPERRLWLQAWLLLPLASTGLKLFGLNRVSSVLHRFTRRTAGRLDLPAAQALARIFHSAVHRSILPSRCLERSLVLHWLLDRQGLDAALRIGVARAEGRLEAHAWVEHGGVALEANGMNRDFVAFDQALMASQGGDG